MQASKIMPGTIYAVKHAGGLVRFKVKAINTSRYQATGGPHDYKSSVVGTVLDGLVEDKTVEPNAVLGPYEEYAELVEQKRREDAERDRQGAERVQAVQALWRTLYEKTGQPCPNDPTAYHQPFRVDTGGTIRIDIKGVALLSAALCGVVATGRGEG